MSLLRFTSAQQVFDTFPILREDVKLAPLDAEPFTYIDRLLASREPYQALAFCAFLLPRRDAVRWFCQILRDPELAGDAESERLLKLAENWVASPSETARKDAMNGGAIADQKRAAAWAALAAGWSGGSMTDDPEHPLPPPPHLTGLACKVGLQLLLVHLSPIQHIEKVNEFVAKAVHFLRQGKA